MVAKTYRELDATDVLLNRLLTTQGPATGNVERHLLEDVYIEFMANAAIDGMATASPLLGYRKTVRGYWYQPDNLDMMYQAENFTTPVTANNDPVRELRDRSQYNVYTRAPSDPERPLYQTSAGKHWLQYDGTDDILTRSDASLALQNAHAGLLVTIAMRAATEDAAAGVARTVWGEHTSSSFVRYRVSNGPTTGSKRQKVKYFYTETGGNRIDLESTANVFDGNDHVVQIQDTLTNAYLWVDGVLEASAAYTAVARPSLATMALGARFDSAGKAEFFSGRVYQLIGRAGPVSEAIRKMDYDYCANLLP